MSAMTADVLDRFMSRVSKREDGCWEWTGSRMQSGYGQFTPGRTWGTTRAHRAAYEHFVGPVPDGLELDHLCNYRACCNPDHLEPVTHAENMRRAGERRTHCIRGHEFTESNTYLPPDGSARQCRICSCVRKAERKRARAAA